MSARIEPNQYYDFMNHCDDECKRIIIPYIDNIQRMLFEEHKNNPYYEIASVLKSICSAYYCKHLQYRLSFKTLFSKYPTDYHYDPHCKYNLSSCPSIQRIAHILNNFQSYKICSTDAISPYITYKYYQIKEILSDIEHINHQHPQNTVKFYIRNSIMPRNVFECADVCSQYEHNTFECAESFNYMEQWIKYNIFNIHQQFIHYSECEQQFESALNHIITFNESEHINSLLDTLRTVTYRLYKNNIKYRTFLMTNPIIQRKLLGFEGVLQFLSLLGFESNALGTKLMCHHPPSMHFIQIAMSSINASYAKTYTNIGLETKQTEPVMIDTLIRINPPSIAQNKMLESSGTDYIDINDEVAVSMELKVNNKDNVGIMRSM